MDCSCTLFRVLISQLFLTDENWVFFISLSSKILKFYALVYTTYGFNQTIYCGCNSIQKFRWNEHSLMGSFVCFLILAFVNQFQVYWLNPYAIKSNKTFSDKIKQVDFGISCIKWRITPITLISGVEWRFTVFTIYAV